jgi:glycosyltransferase involved in cell wall biosynthesis
MTNNPKILVAVPMYNCEKQITSTLDAILRNSGGIAEVWVIDNQSSDQSLYIAQTYIENSKAHQFLFKLFRNKENIGLGGTHKITFDMASIEEFTHVLIFHGDHQAQAADMGDFIKLVFNQPEAIILGSRFMKKSSRIGYSKPRTLANLFFNTIFTVREGKVIKDLGSGLNVFPVEVTKRINLSYLPNDLTFNIALLRQLLKSDKKIIWRPIEWREDEQISNVKIFSQTISTLRLILLNQKKSYKSDHATERLL